MTRIPHKITFYILARRGHLSLIIGAGISDIDNKDNIKILKIIIEETKT